MMKFESSISRPVPVGPPVSEEEDDVGKSASTVLPRNSSALTSDNFLFFVLNPRLVLDSSNICD